MTDFRKRGSKPKNPYTIPNDEDSSTHGSSTTGSGRYANTADSDVANRQSSANRNASSGADNSFLTTLSTWIASLSKWFSRSVRPPPPPPATAETQEAIERITAMKKTTYDNDTNESMLKELWALLQPDMPYERTSSNWGNLGFQGKDPVTDFRGQGILALENLLHIARGKGEELQTIMQKDKLGFPLALVAVNMSHYLCGVLEKHPGLVGNELFRGVADTFDNRSALNRFNALFETIFFRYEVFYSRQIREYLQAGGNAAFVVMQFNPIRDRFAKEVDTEILSGQFKREHVDPAVESAAVPSE
eukprot:m.1036645 g.1036645  ORF g.1036645 m.1036645 type:complete len:304 (-) comp24139_c2_seq34:2888-3799(-)